MDDRRFKKRIVFLIILLLCFILYNWMQRVGTADKTEAGHE